MSMSQRSMQTLSQTTTEKLYRGFFDGIAGFSIGPGLANEAISAASSPAVALAVPIASSLGFLGVAGLGLGLWRARSAIKETDELIEKMRREFFIILNQACDLFDAYGINFNQIEDHLKKITDPESNVDEKAQEAERAEEAKEAKGAEEAKGANEAEKIERAKRAERAKLVTKYYNETPLVNTPEQVIKLEGLDKHLHEYFSLIAKHTNSIDSVFSSSRVAIINLIDEFHEQRKRISENKAIWSKWRETKFAYDDAMNQMFVSCKTFAEMESYMENIQSEQITALKKLITKLQAKLTDKETNARLISQLNTIIGIIDHKDGTDYNALAQFIKKLPEFPKFAENTPTATKEETNKLRSDVINKMKEMDNWHTKMESWNKNKESFKDHHRANLFNSDTSFDKFLKRHCENLIICRRKPLSKSEYLFAGATLFGGLFSTCQLLATGLVALGAVSVGVGTLGIGLIVGAIALTFTAVGMYCYHKTKTFDNHRRETAHQLTILRKNVVYQSDIGMTTLKAEEKAKAEKEEKAKDLPLRPTTPRSPHVRLSVLTGNQPPAGLTDEKLIQLEEVTLADNHFQYTPAAS